jgi:hypothetical protein
VAAEEHPPTPVPPPEEPAGQGAGGGRERRPFLLRIPPQLMEELRAWAAQDLRSLNGHIEWLLQQAVKKRKGKG